MIGQQLQAVEPNQEPWDEVAGVQHISSLVPLVLARWQGKQPTFVEEIAHKGTKAQRALRAFVPPCEFLPEAVAD